MLYPENGKIKEADIKRLGLHLNAMVAGDLEVFLKETQAKLSGLLTQAATLGASILQSMETPTAAINAGVAAPIGASAEKRDPKLKFSNWAVPLIDLIGTPSQANLTPKIEPNIQSRLKQEANQAITTLAQVLQQQANPSQKYTLAWLIQESLKAIKALENKGSASVPMNQTGEYERHTKGDTLKFVSLCDQVGTPQTMTNARDECVWKITQDTWGSTLDLKTVNPDNPFEQSNIRFQGQYYDQETGLHYKRYRYYEPHSARYVSKDPIGLNGGMNTSAYVSDPTQWVDPMGLNGRRVNKYSQDAPWDRHVVKSLGLLTQEQYTVM